MSILLNGDIKEGEYKLIKTTNGWVLDGEDIAYAGVDILQEEADAIDRNTLIDYCLKLIDAERKQGSDVMNCGQERINQTEVIINYVEHMPHINTDNPDEYYEYYTAEEIESMERTSMFNLLASLADRPQGNKAVLIKQMEAYRDKQSATSDYWKGINWAINTIRVSDITDRPTGEWIAKDGVFYCSCCDNDSAGLSEDDVYVYGIPLPNYCKDCGARMKGADDEDV